MSDDTPTVRPLKMDEYFLWDNLVEQSPQGSIFSYSDYLRLLAEASKSSLRILGCFSNDSLLGGCSLLERRKLLLGTYAVSSGLDTPFCGFLYQKTDTTRVRKNEIVYNACIHALCDYIKKEQYSSIQITNSPDLFDLRPFIRSGWRGKVAYTYYIDLHTLSYENFSSYVKNCIKKAMDCGFSYNTDCSIDDHCQIIDDTKKQNNVSSPFHDAQLHKFYDFFQTTHSGHIRAIKDSSGRTVASYFWVWDSQRAYAWNAAMLPGLQDSGVNHLLIYHSLKELQEMGFSEVNIMHANTPHMTGIVTGFNPVLIPYYSVVNDSFLIHFLGGIKQLFNK